MSVKGIDVVVVGADRVAGNGYYNSNNNNATTTTMQQ